MTHHETQTHDHSHDHDNEAHVCEGPSSQSDALGLWANGLTRRSVLKASLGGTFGLLFAQLFDPRLGFAQTPVKAGAKPKNCILLWMNGGPSHIDTWDPKTGPTGGTFKAINTRAQGVQISEHLAQVADHADCMAIVRGMSTKEGNHQRAQYLMHTGYTPNPTVQHPSLGCWVSEELGNPKNDLPNFVSISGPSIGAGFLGVQYGPLVVQNINQPLANVQYAFNVNAQRFDTRQAALAMLDDQFAGETGDNKVKGRQAVYDKAVRLMRSPRLKAFELTDESDATKAAYGTSNFGQGCLMARRLVESGVRFVEVVLDGWDTHNDNFGRVAKQTAMLDSGMAALLKDLKERDLLDSTLVICMGEFGRTPKINGNDGRDHYPGAWSAVLAGGGVRGGQAFGATDGEGGKVVDKPIAPNDFFATLATLLGMPTDKSFMTPVGRPIAITEKGTPIRDLIA